LEGAWLARLGFLLFGLGVIWLSSGAGDEWGGWGVQLHTSFGVLMIAAAVFSARAWDSNVPFDPIEDVLHSIPATAMGFAFALGVVVVILRRVRVDEPFRWLDMCAIVASILIPIAMMLHTGGRP
jgi:TRAP-type mannitol/chloroaromatic compound transport system permease large subunit